MAATLLTTGSYYKTYLHDVTTGLTATLTGTGATVTRASAFTFKAAQETSLQKLHARQLIAVYASGSLAISCDGGQSWATASVAGKTLTAATLDAASSSEYPHGYVGASDGNLYAINDTQGAIATWSVSSSRGTTGSSITALCQPPGGGRGKVWVGCTDGSLWLYTPLQGLLKMAQFAGAITSLGHWITPGRIVVGCASATMGLAIADELAVGSSLLVLWQTAVVSLGTARRAALLAVGSSTAKWSPSGGESLGPFGLPSISGTLSAVAPSFPDPNEVLLGTTATQLFRSYDNGATWTTLSAPAGAALDLLSDPTTPGLYYARFNVSGTATPYVSYDAGASWSALSTGLSGACNDLAAGALMMQ